MYEGNAALTGNVVSPVKGAVTPIDPGFGIDGAFQLPAGGGSVAVGAIGTVGMPHISIIVQDSGLGTPPASGTIINVYASINGVNVLLDSFLWPVGQTSVREEYHGVVAEGVGLTCVAPVGQLAGNISLGAIQASSL